MIKIPPEYNDDDLPDWLQPDPWWTRFKRWLRRWIPATCAKCKERTWLSEISGGHTCWKCWSDEYDRANW